MKYDSISTYLFSSTTLFTLIVALLWTTPVTAQRSDNAAEHNDARFTPLQLGNLWEYSYWEQFWPWDADSMKAGEPHAPVLKGYLITQVLRDSLVNNDRYAIIRQQRFSLVGSLVSSYECGVKVLTSGEVEFPEQDGVEGLCERWDVIDYQLSLPLGNAEREYHFNTDSTFLPFEVLVGDIAYKLEATGWRISSQVHGAFWKMDYGLDLGLFRWTDSRPPRLISGSINTFQLSYAEVGDQIYGKALAVHAEQEITNLKPPFRLNSASPNPTKGEVRLSIESSTGMMAKIEVYNVRGRQLEELYSYINLGQSMVQLNMTRYPSGVYFIRMASPNGFTVHQAVIKH